MWTILANNYWLELGLVIGLPALLVVFVRQLWLLRAMGAWLLLPLVVLCGALVREWALRPDQAVAGASVGHALLVVGMPTMLVWVFFSVIGFGLGFALRAFVRRGRADSATPTIARSNQTLLQTHAAPNLTLNSSPQAVQGGSIRVDFNQIEWSGNGHWINNPRVTVMATGAVLLDLWNTDADAIAHFPAPDVVELDIALWTKRSKLLVTINLVNHSYRIDGRNSGDTLRIEGHLQDLPRAFEDAALSMPTQAGQAQMAQAGQKPAPKVAWRSGAVILLAALGAVGAVGVISRSGIGQGVTVKPLMTVPPFLPPSPQDKTIKMPMPGP